MDTATANLVCAILAGGRGKRMGQPNVPKTCSLVAGRPAVVRVIDACKDAGLRRFLVVVGGSTPARTRDCGVSWWSSGNRPKASCGQS
jgi:GTP:adenosylcobinamide-phosphate guanylyltransferase